MEKINELFEKYKDMNDCSKYEFIDLYDSLLTELTNLKSNYATDLRNMYNHEYAIVNGWPTSGGSETIYNDKRIKGFKKMKMILNAVHQ